MKIQKKQETRSIPQDISLRKYQKMLVNASTVPHEISQFRYTWVLNTENEVN